MLCKEKPVSVSNGIGVCDKEGRCITVEFPTFYIVAVSVRSFCPVTASPACECQCFHFANLTRPEPGFSVCAVMPCLQSYVPNSGQTLQFTATRATWDSAMHAHLVKLNGILASSLHPPFLCRCWCCACV